jgi:putative hydrolase of HD superfamily
MTTSTLDLLLAGNQLKRTARTGWVMRGIPNGEDVAAHSFGVAWTALLLANQIALDSGKSFDMARLLSMALIHDVPEGKTTDIPTPAWRFLPAGVKPDIERGVMQAIAGDNAQRDQLLSLWEEMNGRETAESKLVHDADKLEMYLQVWQYEQQFGNQQLAEFWDKQHQFHFELCQSIYDEIRSLRNG